MWKLAPEAEYEKHRRWYERKKPNELMAVEANLKKYFAALQAGSKPQQIVSKFVNHREQSGVRAIDESGSGRKLAATRLYVFPDEGTETLHVITLGDKQTQKDDIKYCKEFVESIRESKQQKKDAEKHVQDKEEVR